MAISLFPPPLVLQPRNPANKAGNGVGEASSSASSSRPNLMPFSIEYTGPANVDGYLVVHKQSELSAPTSHPTASSSKSIDSGDPLVSHFRGRRLFATDVPLPDGWAGDIFVMRKDQQTTASSPTGIIGTAAGLSSSSSSAFAQQQQEEEERRDLVRRREKRRKRNAAAAEPVRPNKAQASFGGFSMDDDDDDDDAGEVDGMNGVDEYEDGDAMAQDEQGDFDEPDQSPSPSPGLGEDNIDDAQASSGGGSALKSAFAAPPRVINSLQALPSSRFNAIRIWNADGPLDQGDDEFVKVLKEQTSLAAMLARPDP